MYHKRAKLRGAPAPTTGADIAPVPPMVPAGVYDAIVSVGVDTVPLGVSGLIAIDCPLIVPLGV